MMQNKLKAVYTNHETNSTNEGKSTFHTSIVEGLCIVDEHENPVTALYFGKTEEIEAEVTSDYYDFHTGTFNFYVFGQFIFVINTLFDSKGVYL